MKIWKLRETFKLNLKVGVWFGVVIHLGTDEGELYMPSERNLNKAQWSVSRHCVDINKFEKQSALT